MKYNRLITLVFAIVLIVISSCSKKLEEQPYTVFSVDYFKTPSGFQSGVNAVYSGTRFLFGPEGAASVGTSGTDEWAMGDQARAGAAGDLTSFCNYTLDNTGGSILTPWNRSFNNINLANALIDFAPNVDISPAEKTILLGELRFLRALYYFNLVQYFGAVPLDLGSGELKFNETPFQGFNRLPVADVLTKNYQAIIDDLLFATQNLPDKRPAGAFRVAKAAAYHLLSRSYIHRAYSSAKQPSDFSSAYTAAMQVINNQATYGVALQQNFSDVHREGNDYNSEILFAVERLPGNYAANEVPVPDGIGGTKGMDVCNDFVGNYTAVTSPLASSSTLPCGTRKTTYGRPIRRWCPTPWLYNIAFNDKVNDSRYQGSFRTTYIATQTGGGFTLDVDTGFVLALTNRIADSLNGISPAGPRLKPYRVVAPREFYFTGGTTVAATQNMYPSLSKYEDSNKGGAGNFNWGAGRPFPVCKLGETYLLAAEAAIGDNRPADALVLIKTLRERAVNRPGLTQAQIDARKLLIMQRINTTTGEYIASPMTAADMTLDFILNERTRELCGESVRWGDLAVRGKLVERVQAFNTDGAANIRAGKHELRPIPREQLDRISDPDKAKYQNPGY